MTGHRTASPPPLTDSSGVTEAEALFSMSPAEERFERWRRTVGLFAGPAVFAIIWALPTPALTVPAHRLAAIASLVVVWWITEPVPLPATALIGAALMAVCGVTSAADAFSQFANPTIFLFIGSFIIGQAATEHGLDRRLAFTLLSARAVQGSLVRVALTMAGLTLALSAWMSNTATTAMMLPVAVGVLRATGVLGHGRGRKAASIFLLSIAYAASIGGIMTPVGTPPNLIGIGLLDRIAHVHINFVTWMVVAIPISLAASAVLLALTARRVGAAARASGRTALPSIEPPKDAWTAGQRNCAIAFGLAIVAWVTPGAMGLLAPGSALTTWLASHVHESVVAVLAASLLFVLPVDFAGRRFTIDWKTAARIDWGTILLFGGGLALGDQMFSTGLAGVIGRALVAASGAESLWSITAMAIVISILLTEIASNTAATNMLVPVILSVAMAAGVNPIPPALGVTIGASMAFVLPVSTPPNAIVYGSGMVPILTMVRTGIVLDTIAVLVILAGLRILCPLVGFA
jgi:sodium-dependent dicarboxylate transporter 2/3/5